jgi:lysophospholipase L1-like esterase
MKKVFPAVLGITFSFVIGLLIAEMIARYLYPIPGNLEGTTIIKVGTPPKFLPEVGTFPWANSSIRHRVIGDFDNVVKFNSRGMRGQVVPYSKAPGEYRILYIGDSFVEAAEVADSEIVYRQLEDLFGSAGSKVTVIGAGQSGWGTDQQYLFYMNEGYKYQPDLVIYQFVTNDVTDNARSSFGHKSRSHQYFQLVDDRLVLAERPARADSDWFYALIKLNRHLYLESRLYALIKNVWKSDRGTDPAEPIYTQLKPETGAAPNPLLYLFQDPYQKAIEDAWNLTEAIMEKWQSLARANGSELAVVYAPSHWAINDWERIPELFPVLKDEFAAWDSEKPDRYLEKITGASNIPFHSMTEAFFECSDRTGVRYYFTNDGHWNPDGHKVAARSVYGWLQKRLPKGMPATANASELDPCI